MPEIDPDYSRREAVAVAAIKDAIPPEFKNHMISESKGLFTELYRFSRIPKYFFSTAIDGVGTKIILAIAMNKYDTVGIDCVAMAANDKAAHPGNGNILPFLYMDYLACQSEIEEEGITGDIIRGLVKGLELSDASEVMRIPLRPNMAKGETASLDEVISGPRPGYGFDLAGAMIGLAPKSKVKLDLTPMPGQEIIAFESSGGHSNGYTDFRLRLLKGDFEQRREFKNRYKGRHSLDDKMPGSEKTIGEELLTPTRIYTKPMAKIASQGIKVIGINSTGYGLHNFNRVGKGVEYVISDPLEPQDIFKLMQEESGFDNQTMFRKFNMGMGFYAICNPSDSDKVIGAANEDGMRAARVGKVKAYDGGPRVQLAMGKGEPLFFKGYG